MKDHFILIGLWTNIHRLEAFIKAKGLTKNLLKAHSQIPPMYNDLYK